MRKKRSLWNKPALGLAVPILLFFLGEAQAAPANFYSLHDRWEKSHGETVSKSEAVDASFRRALTERGAESAGDPYAPPAAIEKTLSQIKSSGQTVEIEVNQTLYIRSDVPVQKFITTHEDIVTAETADPGVLRVIGRKAGRTFMHVWDQNGRSTFEIRVIPQRFRGPSFADIHREAVEHTRSFRLHYNNSRSAFYTGDKVRDISRRSLDFIQRFGIDGDTPYGYFTSHAQVQRSGLSSKHVLTEIQGALHDARIGPFENFNVAVGDSDVTPNMAIFSQGRIRGVAADHEDDQERVKLSTFYGREQSSIVGVISPGFGTQKRTKDSFLSGHMIDYKLNDDARFQAGYFTGSGRDRADELNRQGFGFKGDFGLGPYFRYQPEYNHDTEHTAHRQRLILDTEFLDASAEFRDIGKNFQSMLGASSRQGELGSRFEVSAVPAKWAHFRGSLDIFRDRRIPNPDDLDAQNVHTDLSLTVIPAERSNVVFSYQNIDDTGRVGPSRLKTWGVRYSQGLDVWGRKATFTAAYQNRESNILNNPVSDYENDQVSLGLYTRLFWNIVFSVQKEWNWLEEPNVFRQSRPEAITYTFSYARQLWDTPFSVDMTLRIRDEEDTESPNSFMIGEDSTEFSAGLYYRPNADVEYFVTGRLQNYVPESLDVESPRVEAQLITGVRITHDTGLRWDTVGHFEGSVFKDLNGDGVRQPDEPGLEGMKVTGGGQEVLTDADGRYAIRSVSGKRATLILDTARLPYGFVPTGSLKRQITFEHDETVRVDFGLVPRSEVHGIIFNDLNGNGVYDTGDRGLRKIRLSLEDGQKTFSKLNGSYSFSNVLAGEHTVRLDLATLPEGYLPLAYPEKKITVYEGIRYELNFPVRAQRAVTGRVFADRNGSGILDPEEPVLTGVRVFLGSQSIRTDANGRYLFENLAPGDYRLSVDADSLPPRHYSVWKESLVFSEEPATRTAMDIPVLEKPLERPEPVLRRESDAADLDSVDG